MQKQLETTNIKNNPTWSSPLHLCRSLSEDGLKNRKNQIKLLQMERMSLLTVLRLLHEDKGAEDSEKNKPTLLLHHKIMWNRHKMEITGELLNQKKKKRATPSESENQGKEICKTK